MDEVGTLIDGLIAVVAFSFILLGVAWWKLFKARQEAKSSHRFAAICVTISNAWLLLALTLPATLPSDSSRLWFATLGGNFVVMGLVAAIAIFVRGPGRSSILCASVLSAIVWGSFYVIDSMIVV